ncbi:hypothetical protein HPP92_028060 [Vanilla planifolia]|uniref:Uncharacterized protein n=1 Tax=Vanilla planifolia TaxID=51239 RepID=A0A835P9D1_VANPL|nr:hypothetical protein HPP92_028060 [Vanilla planifolia]
MPEMEKVVFMSGEDREGHPGGGSSAWRRASVSFWISSPEAFLPWFRSLISGTRYGCSRGSSTNPLSALDNYPEFLAKQVFVNVPWWYLAFNRMISPFFDTEDKEQACALGRRSQPRPFRYIAPGTSSHPPGGLYSEKDLISPITNSAKEAIIQPSAKKIIEIPLTEPCLLDLGACVLGWDVSKGAEFVLSSGELHDHSIKGREDSFHDDPIVKSSQVGELESFFTIDNNSKEKKLLSTGTRRRVLNQLK